MILNTSIVVTEWALQYYISGEYVFSQYTSKPASWSLTSFFCLAHFDNFGSIMAVTLLITFLGLLRLALADFPDCTSGVVSDIPLSTSFYNYVAMLAIRYS